MSHYKKQPGGPGRTGEAGKSGRSLEDVAVMEGEPAAKNQRQHPSEVVVEAAAEETK